MKPILFFLLVSLTGCSTSTRVSRPRCEVTERAITPDEETALGVSGRHLTDSIPEATEGVLTWSAGASSSLSAVFTPDGTTLRYLDSETVVPDGDIVLSIAVFCSDSLAIDGDLTLRSDDGLLDETISVTFTLSEDDLSGPLVRLDTPLDPSAMGGDFILADHVDEGRYDKVELWLEGHLWDGVFSGELVALAEGSDEETVFVEHIELASFDSE